MEVLKGEFIHTTEYRGPVCAACPGQGDMVAIPLRAGMTVVLCRHCIVRAMARLHPAPTYNPHDGKDWYERNE